MQVTRFKDSFSLKTAPHSPSPAGSPSSFSQITSLLCSACYLLTVHFLSSLMCFYLHFCCFRVAVIDSSRQPPALLCLSSAPRVSPPPALTQPLDPCSFALRLDGSGSPHPSSRTPPAPGSTSRQPQLSFAMALQAVRDLAAFLPQEEVPHFAHESQVHHQSSSTKQTPGRQMLSQDLLLLTQHPDCCTAPTSLCNQLLFGIRSSPAFNVMCFQFSHPPCPPAK